MTPIPVSLLARADRVLFGKPYRPWLSEGGEPETLGPSGSRCLGYRLSGTHLRRCRGLSRCGAMSDTRPVCRYVRHTQASRSTLGTSSASLSVNDPVASGAEEATADGVECAGVLGAADRAVDHRPVPWVSAYQTSKSATMEDWVRIPAAMACQNAAERTLPPFGFAT